MTIEEARRRRVTSADVAREVGVSRTTVSYVLNDVPHQKIPSATRDKVLEAASRLGYAPSAAARALRSGRSDIVLCLLPDWPIGTEVGRFLEFLSRNLAAEGLTFVTHPRAKNTRPTADIWKSISPAAVITYEAASEAEIAEMRSAGIDVTLSLIGLMNGSQPEPMISQQRVGRLQVEHLAAAGHQHIGYAFPDDKRLDSFSLPRLEGVRLACADLGLAEPDVRPVPLEPTAASLAVQDWRNADSAITGVCAYNDEVALAVLAGMRQLGLRAPVDMAVVGVDDIPAASLADPPLSSVVTDQETVAAHITKTIMRGLAGRSAPRLLGTDALRVIARGSV